MGGKWLHLCCAGSEEEKQAPLMEEIFLRSFGLSREAKEQAAV